MNGLDISILEAVTEYKYLISHFPIFYLVLLSALIFGILIVMNLNTKTSFYLTLLALIVGVAIIIYTRGLDIFAEVGSMFNLSFYQNIYFYYWNTIVAFVVVHCVLASKKQEKVTKVITIIFYVLLMGNFIYSFYITGMVKNIYGLVIENLAGIIILGNVLTIIMYLYLITLNVVAYIRKEY